MVGDSDFKKAHGFTNHAIALGLNDLNDEEFFEVFVELAAMNGHEIKEGLPQLDDFLAWLRQCLIECGGETFGE